MKRLERSSVRKLPVRTSQALAIACALAVPCAQAIELDTGNPDWAVRFDNTIKAGTIYRLKNADAALANSLGSNGFPTGLGLNAGDDNFRKKGFVSKRLDLL